MADARKEMNDALKEVVVPLLRKLDFKGSFPHFYRELDRHVDLLSFQFRLAGGSFVAELSFAEPGRDNIYINKEAPVNRLRVSQTSKRLRLGAKGPGSDNWFSFELVGFLKRQPDYRCIASQVAVLIEQQAIPWWEEKRQ
jgi:hypothetical protein